MKFKYIAKTIEDAKKIYTILRSRKANEVLNIMTTPNQLTNSFSLLGNVTDVKIDGKNIIVESDLNTKIGEKYLKFANEEYPQHFTIVTADNSIPVTEQEKPIITHLYTHMLYSPVGLQTSQQTKKRDISGFFKEIIGEDK